MKEIWRLYSTAWQFLLSQKRLVFILYSVNLLIAFLAVGPLNTYLTSVFKNSNSIDNLAAGFDYSIITDVLNNYGIGMEISITNIFSFIVIYLIWSVFSSAGIVGLYAANNLQITNFWIGGIKHFIKFLRLTIFILIFYVVVMLLMWLFFTKDGLRVLEFESEIFLINRFWILAVMFVVISFMVSIFRDLAKARIVQNFETTVYRTNLSALKATFKIKAIGLSLVNLFALAFVTLLYFVLKDLVANSFLLAFLLGQVYLAFRICYRFVRLVSFYEIARST